MQELMGRRRRAADIAFENHNFNGACVDAYDGWGSSGDTWFRTVYFDVGLENTAKGDFTVKFAPGSDEIVRVG